MIVTLIVIIECVDKLNANLTEPSFEWAVLIII